MKRIISIIFISLAALASAESFSIKSPDGTISGPFELKNGITVSIGETKGVITSLQSDEDLLVTRMKEIIIPDLDFRETPIRKVVGFMMKASSKYSKDHRGVSFIVKLGNSADSIPDNTPDPWGTDTNTVAAEPTVTFSALDITLKETLDIVVDIANLKYQIHNGIIKIVPINTPDGELVHAEFFLAPGLRERLLKAEDEIGIKTEAYNASAKKFLAEMGIKWPIGSNIGYMPSMGRLMITNTQNNIDEIKKMFDMFYVDYPQLEIEMQYVSFKSEQVKQASANGIDDNTLINLWTNGYGKLIYNPKVLTLNKTPAGIIGATECIYPTDFVVRNEVSNNTNAVWVVPAVEPGDFEARRIGVSLNVTPEIISGSNMIKLSISAEVTEPPVWEDYGGTYDDINGKKQHMHMPQPFFHTYITDTDIVVAEGEKVLVGGGMPSYDGTHIIYAFITAKVVGIKGLQDCSAPIFYGCSF